MRPAGAIVLNLPVVPLAPGFYRAGAADAAILLAQAGEPVAAAASLAAGCVRLPEEEDWPDRLAAALRKDMDLPLRRWAAEHGLRPNRLATGFSSLFGVTPKRFRAELRAAKAVRLIRSSPTPLAQLAAGLGFTDQAHMTRAVLAVAGRTPGRLRATAPMAAPGPSAAASGPLVTTRASA
jgi:AraC-like DNA-binding protein